MGPGGQILGLSIISGWEGFVNDQLVKINVAFNIIQAEYFAKENVLQAWWCNIAIVFS